MKRLGILAALLLAALPAWANVCSTQASGLFSNSAVWKDCPSPGGIPATTDQMIINHSVLYDMTDRGCTTGATKLCIRVTGTFTFDESSTNRDADGWRTFIATADAGAGLDYYVSSTGTWEQGRSDRLRFDTSAGAALGQWDPGSKIKIRGQTWDTTVASIVDAAATAPVCGNTRGRVFTITPTAYAEKAKLYRRVVFKSGKARNRHFNIAAVAADGSTFTICTHETDAAAPCTAAGVPYGFCTGANAPQDASCHGVNLPYTACPAAGVSKNNQRLYPHATYVGAHALPVSQTSIPAPYGNSICVAAGNPDVCCTGAGTGRCLGAIPAVGDEVTIIDDAVIDRSAGTNGWSLFNPSQGTTTMPEIQAVNISNGGSASGSMISLAANTSGLPCVVSYNNLHDYTPAWGMDIDGCQPMTVTWNACHDAGASADESAGCIELGSSNTVAARSVTFTDNIGWRARGQVFSLFGGSETNRVVAPNIVQRNLVFDSCTTDTGECDGWQIGNMDDVKVSDNLTYNIYRGDGRPLSKGMALSGAPSPLGGQPAIYNNIFLNIGGTGINNRTPPGSSNPFGYGCQVYGITGNYISNTRAFGIRGGGYAYGNVVKNWGLRNGATAESSAISGVINVKGNALLIDDAVAASADCSGGQFCQRFGIEWQLGDSAIDNKVPATVTDNYIGGKFTPSGGAPGKGITTNAFAGTDQNLTIQHNTCDGHGAALRCIDASHMVPSVLRTVTASDNAATHLNNERAFQASVDSNCRCFVDRTYRTSVGSSLASTLANNTCAGAGSTNTNETAVPTLMLEDRLTPDFEPTSRSALIGAGGAPSGSSIGIRAFAFDFEKWRSLWPVMSFDAPLPKSFTNADSGDLDGDGVVDLLDNCKSTWNPGQHDANQDGNGDACGG